jgi:hypothetical protein
MTDAIIVAIREPTERGRLYPRAVHMGKDLWIVLESPVRRPCPYGLNIGWDIQCDIDADGLLVNVDVEVGVRHWRVTNTVAQPSATRRADVILTRSTLERNSFPWDVEVRTDKHRSLAVISWNDAETFSECIELSSECYALVRGDCLIGFVVVVPRTARGTA